MTEGTRSRKYLQRKKISICNPGLFTVDPLSVNFTKWPNTLFDLFDHFVRLALKGLR